MTDHQREMRRKCAWSACDHWMHINQCLKHAVRFEPDVYDLKETDCVSGHPCVYSETCGFEEKRSPLVEPTESEMAAYQSEVRRDAIMSTLKSVSEGLDRLKELLTEEFKATSNDRTE